MSEIPVDPALLAIVRSAAAALASDWRLEISPGSTSASVELRLVGPDERRLGGRTKHRGGPTFAAYRRLADLMFEAQRKGHPELELAWGGNWTTEDGRWQVGRFVLGEFRGRGSYRRPQDRAEALLAAANARKAAMSL